MPTDDGILDKQQKRAQSVFPAAAAFRKPFELHMTVSPYSAIRKMGTNRLLILVAQLVRPQHRIYAVEIIISKIES